MAEDGFDEEMRGIALTVHEILNHTEDEGIISRLESVIASLTNLQGFYQEALEKKTVESDEKEEFQLRYARLAGLSEQFTALGRKRPESACGTFKAQQVNRILQAVKELLGEDAGFALPLVSETGEQNYGDVSLLLRGWLDLCADYAWRHYDGNPPEIPQRDDNFRHRLVQEQILAFCQDEPKSMLEIGEMLCYRDRKTIRGYIAPLLDAGLLARTVPDKPNSRNQKYVTARMM